MTQTGGSVSADRIEQVTTTMFHSKFMKFVDCFLDGHGNSTINLVSFEIKSLWTNHLLISKEVFYEPIGGAK